MRYETKQLIEKAASFEAKMKEMEIKITGRKVINNFDPKKAEVGDPLRFVFEVTIE